jgi:hypothetical protein
VRRLPKRPSPDTSAVSRRWRRSVTIRCWTDYIKPEETFIACPNQDVAYGAGFTALDKEPTVVQVPDFGARFYVYAMYDQRTDEVGRIGKQYGTKPGFYMLVGPNWKGDLPKRIGLEVGFAMRV